VAFDLPRIKARTLVVAGREDALFALEACRSFARAIPDASFAAIDVAAHSIHLENPRKFTAAILEFLSSQR
jgi:pimeloyl-ACP methyl ester carboxylesterase